MCFYRKIKRNVRAPFVLSMLFMLPPIIFLFLIPFIGDFSDEIAVGMIMSLFVGIGFFFAWFFPSYYSNKEQYKVFENGIEIYHGKRHTSTIEFTEVQQIVIVNAAIRVYLGSLSKFDRPHFEYIKNAEGYYDSVQRAYALLMEKQVELDGSSQKMNNVYIEKIPRLYDFVVQDFSVIRNIQEKAKCPVVILKDVYDRYADQMDTVDDDMIIVR